MPTSDRGRSSAGRAPRSQCGGQGFNSPRLHQSASPKKLNVSRRLTPREKCERETAGGVASSHLPINRRLRTNLMPACLFLSKPVANRAHANAPGKSACRRGFCPLTGIYWRRRRLILRQRSHFATLSLPARSGRFARPVHRSRKELSHVRVFTSCRARPSKCSWRGRAPGSARRSWPRVVQRHII